MEKTLYVCLPYRYNIKGQAFATMTHVSTEPITGTDGDILKVTYSDGETVPTEFELYREEEG